MKNDAGWIVPVLSSITLRSPSCCAIKSLKGGFITLYDAVSNFNSRLTSDRIMVSC